MVILNLLRDVLHLSGTPQQMSIGQESSFYISMCTGHCLLAVSLAMQQSAHQGILKRKIKLLPLSVVLWSVGLKPLGWHPFPGRLTLGMTAVARCSPTGPVYYSRANFSLSTWENGFTMIECWDILHASNHKAFKIIFKSFFFLSNAKEKSHVKPWL